MEHFTFETYSLELLDNELGTCSIKLHPKTGLGMLSARRKIYIIHSGETILYVGEAHTSLKIRFQRGCTSFNRYIRNNNVAYRGYQGYKWLNAINNINRQLTVSVAIFNESLDEDLERKFIEAVEAELVYLIRSTFGHWPKFQNEIHFSNCEDAEQIAKAILSKSLNRTFC